MRKVLKDNCVTAELLLRKKEKRGQATILIFKKVVFFIVVCPRFFLEAPWKMADSIKAFSSRETRSGTFDIHLNRIGD
jgi:hypothetical protein